MKRFEKADFFCLVMTVVWGANISVVKGALGELSPLAFNGIRMLMGSLVLYFVARLLAGPRPLIPNHFFAIVALGVMGNTLYQLFFIYGLEATKAGNVALLMSAASVFTALFSRALGHEKLTPLVWGGILISLGGVFAILIESGEFNVGVGSLKGDLLVLIATVCWSSYVVLSKKYMDRFPPLVLTGYTLLAGSFVLLLISLPSIATEDWGAVTWRGYLALGYSSLFAIAVGYALWFYAVDRIGSTKTAIYGNLIPFFGVSLAWLLLGERVTLLQLLGGGLIVTGIYLSRLGRPPDAPTAIRRRQS
jgi:drug/metabolite transporter (DMT)-like permease